MSASRLAAEPGSTGTPAMFTQIVEFTTDRIEELNSYFDDWIARSNGERVPHRAVVLTDRSAPDVHVLLVEFASHDAAVENSARPRTGEFAAFLGQLAEGPLGFRSFDV